MWWLGLTLLIGAALTALVWTEWRHIEPRLLRLHGWVMAREHGIGVYAGATIIVAVPCALLAGLLTCHGLVPGARPPDLRLRLLAPGSPVIEVWNDGGATAEDVVVTVSALNLDDPKQGGFVPIQARSSSSVPPGARWPVPLAPEPIAAALDARDRIVGDVQIGCPRCPRPRSYWFSLRYGESGWYAEMPWSPGWAEWLPGYPRNRQRLAGEWERRVPAPLRIALERDEAEPPAD